MGKNVAFLQCDGSKRFSRRPRAFILFDMIPLRRRSKTCESMGANEFHATAARDWWNRSVSNTHRSLFLRLSLELHFMRVRRKVDAVGVRFFSMRTCQERAPSTQTSRVWNNLPWTAWT
eukprot:scaffold17_cov354-Pavlova_lutheri.AAC.39